MADPSSTRLRQMLADPEKIVVCPGVYDGISARLALNAGFDALYMTGAGTSMSRLGMADLGLATMTEMKNNAEMISNLDRSVPVIADADTGYGAPINVGRTVAAYIAAGVAAFHLEDQVVNKKCGHLAGKQLVSKDEYLTRIRAAVEMRRRLQSDIIIIARTDALQSLGLEEALVRLQAAVDAGADVAFLEAISTREQAEAVCRAFKDSSVPVMYGMVQGSKAYKMTPTEAKNMGFKIIVYAAVCLAPTFLSVSKALETLKEDGDCEKYGPEANPHRLFDACGMQELLEFDRVSAGLLN
ncbi:methylisocitrate lyase [Exophiala viscosa]|uniref:Methylisocitrate lyase n=1 Tax=Exophiala viscosa TaxID=2486360 RepID=A0AAN6DLJ3_9EURO|nr:methylisocitrate lyase [Exophiala viscosa]KAI1620127.1 methylisocitrate lyase [Exophiala viscosa]